MSTSKPLENTLFGKISSKIIGAWYLNADQADVHFIIKLKDKTVVEVPAHLNVLTTGSDVFKKMFNESWKEKSEVVIVDATASAFKEFLQFFYLDKIELTMQNIAEVMNLGEKYNIGGCSTVCANFLEANLTVENVCAAYGLAILFEQKDLHEACEYKIVAMTPDIVKTPGFIDSKSNVLAHILKLVCLNCSEVDLFEAYMDWVKAAAKSDTLTEEAVHTHLGEAFFNFRFGAMSIETFAKLMPEYKQVFTKDEYADIIQMIGNKDFQSNIFCNVRQSRFLPGPSSSTVTTASSFRSSSDEDDSIFSSL